jgi:hypothetical protein
MAKSIVALESLLAAVPAALSHGLFAEARTIPLSVDQILFSAGDEGDGCYRHRSGTSQGKRHWAVVSAFSQCSAPVPSSVSCP